MRNLMALLYYLCALLGCDVGGNTTLHRINVDGVDVLDSKVRVTEQIARFECRASRSGQCHYALFRGDCVAAKPAPAGASANASACTAPQAFERFELAAGDTREVIDIASGFKVCVSVNNEAMGADCKPLPHP